MMYRACTTADELFYVSLFITADLFLVLATAVENDKLELVVVYSRTKVSLEIVLQLAVVLHTVTNLHIPTSR
jgi:hypothetical protein